MSWWTARTRLLRLVVALAALALVVAACPADDDDPVEAAPDDEVEEAPEDEVVEEPPDTTFLTLATGSTGGTYFPLGGAMAGVWNDNIGEVRVSTQSSGASVENLRLLDVGEVDIIMAVNGVAADAMAGAGAFEDDGPIDDIMFLGNVYAEVTQVIARADSGIESIADMDGMRIATGPPGSGTEVIARTMLDYYLLGKVPQGLHLQTPEDEVEDDRESD
jgi:TRAP transporter TAXI family solute receptor